MPVPLQPLLSPGFIWKKIESHIFQTEGNKPDVMLQAIFYNCHSALACPHESGECGIQFFFIGFLPLLSQG
jgi:hypothetical protein